MVKEKNNQTYTKNFKCLYKSYIEYFYRQDFPNAVSYNRVILNSVN
jgi:hypothetical protein